jgi:Ca-activated chloride channel family protein
MTAPNENQDPATLDELHDRLIDNSLRELIGNEPPPDLSSRILAANPCPAAASVAAASQAAPPAPRTRKRAFWAALATAAMLLVGATVALLPAIQSSQHSSRGLAERKAAKTSGRLGNSSSQRLSQTRNEFAEATSTPSPYYMTDDVRDLETSLSPSSSGPKDAQSAATDNRGGQAATFDKKLAELSQKPIASTVQSTASNGGEDAYFTQNGLQWQTFGERMSGLQKQQQQLLFNQPQFQQNSTGFGDLMSDAKATTDNYGTASLTSEGTGPGLPGDQYTRIFENPLIKAEGGAAVSTFSIDVDTASYANVRQFLMEMNTLPPPDAVRIEELVNYFDYDYDGPPADAVDAADSPSAPGSAGGSTSADADASAGPAPFAAHVEVAGCPWAADHRLVRIGIKGREMDRNKRPQSNLVFLVDVSGSMNEPNKLPLVVYGLQQLTRELGENDRVAIVVYASSEGLALPSTPGSEQATILAALNRLQAGGSTAGGAGIQLAYQIAEDNFIEGGTNRVILCTDGDFNVGVTSTADLQRLCEQKAKDTRVFLSVLGFGRGNLNDAMMEAISNRGNGNYHYVDNRTEARRVLVEEMTGTLVTIAKDVKIQVEFNPRQVAGYRLIGYENRMLRTEDFNDDTKDAGEIGAGHTVTALYEIVPAGKTVDVTPVDDLKYQQPPNSAAASSSNVSDGENKSDISGELLTLKMRYKQPEGDTSRKLEWAVKDEGKAFGEASTDYQFATAVAGFGLLLRDSQYKGNLTYAAVLELAQAGLGVDEHGYRAEFLEIVRRAKSLRGE